MRSLVFLCVLATTPLWAQEDPMALQRCIWSCLANSPGAASAQYNQCLEARCTEETAEPAQSVPVQVSDWRGGLAADNLHRYVGTQAEQGYGFYYFCKTDQSFFTLDSLPVSPGQYRLIIGTVEFIVPFDMVRGVLSVNIPPRTAFMQAVRSGGQSLTVRAMDGTHLIRFSLQGADAAIGQALRACFG